ncbi:HlyD family efflux transporter periplasmic adaptor subunit [Wohlfahrtiimonas larvae]|uniref:HlyD family efflux transporter periplasmic adaptor subunit n=1 Tax=Wohlfahrtiimonas larvae TaxID=1157986 RepID=A0ABP9MHU4_9GAMM|nr:HlyD family efflux transporter periplasmic adaptor subunit [Wohlfahrtiimonas larvae]
MDKHHFSMWELTERDTQQSRIIIWIILCAFVTFFIWAYFFELDEVSSGSGKVVASSKEQIIQSLEGGVLAKLLVKEGDIVQPGQVLAQLDPTRMESSVGESLAKLHAAKATVARLEAEVSDAPLIFPSEVINDTSLVNSETELFNSKRKSLQETIANLQESQSLIRQELDLTEPLVIKGAASSVEVLRLKRQLVELRTKEIDIHNQYFVKAREELAKAKVDVATQEQIILGRSDVLSRTTITSPVRGIVKDVEINTIGGVIPPNGRLMEIIPMDERLQIETKISPRDIAYIRPGLKATVKISAYDYSIYGGLEGTVELISPDTIQDEVNREIYYYRVYIRTNTDSLKGKDNKDFPIVPGMIATVDIHTGSKTILSFLIKPFNKAREALRER